MKKLLRGALLGAFAAALCATFSFAAPEDFTAVRVEVEGGYQADWRTTPLLRYADDGTPIALSTFYDDSVFAVVPAAYANRALEWFVPEEVKFTDYTLDHSFGFYLLRDLAEAGVIRGDAQGRGEPERLVTRAEAAAMLVRTLGVPLADGAKSGYTDVTADAWYAPAVQTARECGIVSPDTRFEPERTVIREEFVAMKARAYAYAGLASLPEETNLSGLRLQDADAVSDWARAAYLIGDYPITDVESETERDAEGIPVMLAYAEPQRTATRAELANALRDRERLVSWPSKLAREYGFDKEMPRIDGSTSTKPFTDAVYGMLFRNGERRVEYPEKHSKSSIAYERLIRDEVDFIFASTEPTADLKALAKAQGVELTLTPVAHDAMVFFTNADNPANSLTKQQIFEIYADNRHENWNTLGGPDALLYPYCRNRDSGSQAQMERFFLNGHDIHPDIRNETTALSMQSVLTDVIGAETQAPKGYGLGYSVYYYFWNADAVLDTASELKLLQIEGVAPNDKTIADGSYPLASNTYMVLRADEPQDSPARRLAAFMLTKDGQQCVSNAGFGALMATE